MQDPRQYHDINAYVYTRRFVLEADNIWRGIDELERQGFPLAFIAQVLTENWEMSVIALASIGARS